MKMQLMALGEFAFSCVFLYYIILPNLYHGSVKKENMLKNNKNTVVLALTACLLWSGAVVPVKLALKFAPPLFIAGIRFIFAGLILLPFCGPIGNYFKIVSKNIKTIILLSFFQTVLLYGLFFIGMTKIQGALGAVVIGSSPLMAAFVSHFMTRNDKFTLKKTISIFTGIAGIIIVTLNKGALTSGIDKDKIIGISLLITGAISSAIGNVIVSKDEKSIPPLILNSSQIFIGGVVLLSMSFVFEKTPDISGLGPTFYVSLVWLSFISAIAFSIWFTLLQRPDVKVSELNIWKFVIPVAGALMSWLFLPNENPDASIVVAMILVALSVYMLYAPKRNTRVI